MGKNLRLVVSLFAALCLLGLSSCSKSERSASKMFSRIPADADVASVINMKAIVESAGGSLDGSALTLPGYIYENPELMTVERYNEIKDKLASSGLDGSEIGMCFYTGESFGALIFNISDNSKFESFLNNEGYTSRSESGKRPIYSKGDSYCTIDGDFAYFFDVKSSSNEAERLIDKLISGAASKPMSNTEEGRYASEGNAGGIVINTESVIRSMNAVSRLPFPMADSYTGHICLKADIEENEAEIKSVIFDENGRRKGFDSFGLTFDSSAKLSADALAYLPPSECLVYAFALKNVDWDALLDNVGKAVSLEPMQMMAVSMIKTYLEKIDGTAALGIGFEGNQADLVKINEGASLVEYMPLTIVVQTVPGKDKGFIGDIAAVLGTIGLKASVSDNGFSAQLPNGGGAVYGKAENNSIILSTRPIERFGDNGAVKNAEMTDYIGAFSIWLPEEYPFVRDLGVKDNVLLYAVSDMDDSEGKFKIKITGATKGAIVERLLRVGLDYSKGFKTLEEKLGLQSNYTPVDDTDMTDADHFDGFEPTYF